MRNGLPLLSIFPEVQLQHEETLIIPGAIVVWFMRKYGSEAGVSVQLTSAVSPCWIASILVQLSNVGIIGTMPPGRELFRAKVL
jgi:hypothetical protein